MPRYHRVFLFCLQSFQKMFGKEFLEHVDVEGRLPASVERPETSETTSAVLEARGNLSFKEMT